jgi:putative aldouronate transport system substrate-binding protein
MKKSILLVAVLFLISVLSGCGSGQQQSATTQASAETTTTQAAETEKATEAETTTTAAATATTTTAAKTTTTAAGPATTTTTKAAETAADADTGSYTGPDKGVVNPRGVFPIVNEPIQLRIALAENPRVISFDDNEFTKFVEDSTGIDLVFEFLPAQDTAAKVKLLFASDDLPDVFFGGNYMDTAMIIEYGEEGQLIPLDGLIEEFGDSMDYFLEKAFNPFTKALLTSPDGHMYSLPMVVEEFHGMYSERSWIYKPFLDVLGLEIPTTTDEYADMLRAVKTGDPNGNGKADEIPLMYFNEIRYMVRFFMNSFLYWDRLDHMSVNNGVLSPAYFDPAFKAGLEWLNMLCGEGLLDPATFSQDQNTLIALLNAEEVQIGHITHAWVDAGYMDVDSDRRHDYVFMGPLKGPEGVCFTNEIFPGTTMTFQITSKCKYPAVAYRLGDFMLDPYNSLLNRYGVEGRDWAYVDAAAGKTGLNREPAKWELLNDVWQYTTTDVYWRRVGPHFHPLGTFESLVWNGDPFAYNHVLFESALKLQGLQPAEYVPQQKAMTADELSVYLDLRTSIDTYLWENISKFIIGDRGFNEWDAFIDEFGRLGVDKFVSVIQSCYTRMSGG